MAAGSQTAGGLWPEVVVIGGLFGASEFVEDPASIPGNVLGGTLGGRRAVAGERPIEAHLGNMGRMPMLPGAALADLAQLLCEHSTGCGLIDIDWQRWVWAHPGTRRNRLAHLRAHGRRVLRWMASGQTNSGGQSATLYRDCARPLPAAPEGLEKAHIPGSQAADWSCEGA